MNSSRLILISLIPFLTISCTEKKLKSQYSQSDKTELDTQVHELQIEHDRLERLCAESIKRIEELEATRFLAEQAEARRIEADKIELDALYIKKLQDIKSAQQRVWNSYKNVRYDDITTRAGKTYEKVVVTDVDETGLAIVHQSGTARIPFFELSDEIKEKCIDSTEQEISMLKEYIKEQTQARLDIRRQAKQQAKENLQ